MSSSNNDEKVWANRYVSVVRIGRGQYGTAYIVKDCQMKDNQCIKVLKEIPLDGMNEDEIQECLREGKILSKLQHVGIVQFFNSFRLTHDYCIVTEFCDGGNLSQIIQSFKKDGRHFEQKRILRWFIQIVEALNFIHELKILHRDLAAKNIFLKNDSVKIGDFGCSRKLDFTLDMAESFVGTPYYMSPEVLNNICYDAKADIWSAGVILYEMCARKHAFESVGFANVIYKIMHTPCPVIPDYYSKHIQSLIENILIKDPNNRPTAHDILRFPFIVKAMQESRMNLPICFNVDIHPYISKDSTVEMLGETITKNTLTPKQRLEQKKREKADKEAEEKWLQGRRNYKENKAMAQVYKEKSTLDSLPFNNQRPKQSPYVLTRNTENVKHSGFQGSRTVPAIGNIKEKLQSPFLKTDNQCCWNSSISFYNDKLPITNALQLPPFDDVPNHKTELCIVDLEINDDEDNTDTDELESKTSRGRPGRSEDKSQREKRNLQCRRNWFGSDYDRHHRI